MAKRRKGIQMNVLKWKTILASILAGIFLAIANGYLGVKAGMTVSASIPAAVVAIGFFAAIRRKGDVHAINLFQTGAAAGEAMVGGAIFIVPAFVISGVWDDFSGHYWEIVIAIGIGGTLGALFMIPLRRPFIKERGPESTYPEGKACGEIIMSSAAGSGMSIVTGFVIGLLFKAAQSIVRLVTGGVEVVWVWGKRSLFGVGSQVSPAMLGIGYIVGLEVAIPLMVGGIITWLVAMPIWSNMYGIPEAGSLSDSAWTAWADNLRYLGVGGMAVAGCWTIITISGTMWNGLRRAMKGYGKTEQQEDIPTWQLGLMTGLCVVGVFFYYWYMLSGGFESKMLGHALMGLVLIIPISFVFVAVSTYIVGLVGSSNNPVSGMTIFMLLAICLVLRAVGWEGTAGITAALFLATVGCCAACTAADISQDLAAGEIVGTRPRDQQWVQLMAAGAAAFAIPVIMIMLHHAQGIGVDTNPDDGLKPFTAPQATLMAALAKTVMLDQSVPWDMICWGAGIIVFFIIWDFIVKSRRAKKATAIYWQRRQDWNEEHRGDPPGSSEFDVKAAERDIEASLGFAWRMYPMVVAVGLYLPIEMSVPILIGGFVRHITRRMTKDSGETYSRGVMFTSGLIGGEALLGIFIAIPIIAGVKLPIDIPSQWLSLGAFLALAVLVGRVVVRNNNKKN